MGSSQYARAALGLNYQICREYLTYLPLYFIGVLMVIMNVSDSKIFFNSITDYQ